MTDPTGDANRDGITEGLRRTGRVVVGDRTGFVLFLGTFIAVSAVWRTGIFITDTATLVATLDAVAEGRLWIGPAGESHFSAPGAVVTDGLVYGRNYGQVVLGLPILWGLEVLSRVTDLRVGLTALWHLLALAFVVQFARLRRLPAWAVGSGAVVVLGSFVLNLSLATQFVDVSRTLLALQLTTMAATALLATTTYRFVAWRFDRTTGLVVGAASVFVLPVGFWAGFPKRHVFVALLLVCVLYAFARSRTGEWLVSVGTAGELPVYRALSYAFVGVLAWIHAGEAVFVCVALVAVDLPTAPSNDVRTLGLVAGVTALSLLPAFATNLLISGNPLVPPRLLEPASTVAGGGSIGGQAGGTVGGVVGAESTAYSSPVDLSSLPDPLEYVLTVIVDGTLSLAAVDRLYHTWIRSGSTDLIAAPSGNFTGVNLTVLESVPLFGGFAAVVVGAIRRVRERASAAVAGIEATDALALAIAVVFLLIYTPRLPTHVQISVRYLLPIYPLLLYLLVRTPTVRSVVRDRIRLAGWSYAAGVLLGTQLLLAVVVARDVPLASAVQFHGQLGIALAGLLGLVAVVAEFDDRVRVPVAVLLGLAAAAATAFLLLSALAYFPFVGEFVLPVAGRVADVVGPI